MTAERVLRLRGWGAPAQLGRDVLTVLDTHTGAYLAGHVDEQFLVDPDAVDEMYERLTRRLTAPPVDVELERARAEAWKQYDGRFADAERFRFALAAATTPEECRRLAVAR